MNINPIFLIFGILILSLVGVGVILAVIFGVRSLSKDYKQANADSKKTAKKWYAVIILCVVVMILSWIFNIGWLRLILTWIPLPLIHTIAFLFVNFKAANKVSTFKSMKKYMILSCASYSLVYLLLPDGGDVGGMYMFFTLIRNEVITSIMMYISNIIFCVNIASLAIEYSELRKCRP